MIIMCLKVKQLQVFNSSYILPPAQEKCIHLQSSPNSLKICANQVALVTQNNFSKFQVPLELKDKR